MKICETETERLREIVILHINKHIRRYFWQIRLLKMKLNENVLQIFLYDFLLINLNISLFNHFDK